MLVWLASLVVCDAGISHMKWQFLIPADCIPGLIETYDTSVFEHLQPWMDVGQQTQPR